MATIACGAALMLSACDSGSSAATSGAELTEVATSEEPVDDLRKYLPASEPGTYTYTRGPFPVTFTTTEATFDPSKVATPTGSSSVTPTATLCSTSQSTSPTCPSW